MSKRTQKEIVAAFYKLLAEKPFDKITVVDVCERCGVSRSTFYYHYHDTKGLLESLFAADLERISKGGLTVSTWHEAVSTCIEFASKNKVVVSNIYSSLKHNLLEAYLFEAAGALVGQVVDSELDGLDVSRQLRNDLVMVLSGMVVGLLIDWYRRDLSDEYARRICNAGRFMDGFIANSVQKACA